MQYLKYLILGAGPSGLAFAHKLRTLGKYSFLVVEKEDVAGGLCRSENVDGAPVDIGGGHFLDVKRKEVLEFVFRFMPAEEWNVYHRVAKIRIRGLEIDQPLEANLWEFPSEVQVDFLESIAKAGCVQGEVMPESFAEWITWKLGERIAQEYMLPYNRKIWCTDLDQLGTYWLYKLPNVSFRETLLSCLVRRSMGTLPAHGTFLYPKEFGYGELWRRMGEALGDSLVTNCAVEDVDLTSHTVNGRWRGQTIISSIPWTYWPGYCGLPKEILMAIASLKSASINVDYHPRTLMSPAHWIYEPDESISYHRQLLRSNFIPGARGHWTETNATRSSSTNGVRFHNEFAYPINTLGKREAVKKILAWGRSNGVFGLGRWGRWEHMNSDVAVEEALRLASEFNGKVVV
jgi:protoporphyrinogen oxidase